MKELPTNRIICGAAKEVLQTMPAESINCCISSPPYWALRDYGVAGQLGLEKTFEEYIDKLCTIYDEVKRVLRADGTCWVNLGDTFWGGKGQSGQGSPEYQQARQDVSINKPASHVGGQQLTRPQDMLHDTVQAKSLCLIPQRFAIEMVNRGWILRNVIIWAKPNPMPSSAKDRFTVNFEYVYFFVKQRSYFFEPQYEPFLTESNAERPRMGQGNQTKYQQKRGDKIPKQDQLGKATYTGFNARYQQPALGRNKRTVWTIPTQAYPDAHFATFPEKLVEPMILAGCPKEVCTKCGQGRRKIMVDMGEKTWKDARSNQSADSVNVGTRGLSFGRTLQMKFKGYTDCGCGAEWTPGVVLDPFSVAARSARSLPKTDGTGSELSLNRSISKWRNAA